MDHKNTSRAIMAFVILSVIVHGIIAYVIVKTNDDKQKLEPIEFVNQDELNQKPEYKKPAAPKKRIARKKPRVETPRVETPVESEALSQKKAEQKTEEEVLSDLPDTPLNTVSSNDEPTVSDENSKIVVDASEKEGGSSGEGGESGSESVAIQELKKITDAAEQSASEAQDEDNSNVASGQDSNLDSSSVVSDQKSQASKPASQKKHVKAYRVDQVQVVRPTNFKYPQVSRRLKEEGTAILRMFFDKNGNPQKIELIKSTGSIRLDDAARQGANTLRLKSLGYAFIYELPVRFQLDFTDQQLNESIDFLAPGNSGDGLGKFKSQAKSR